MTPDLSIVVPVLNDPRIGRALDSIIDQNHDREIEIIVVDGGSDQPTLDQIDSRRDQISKLVIEPDDGIYDAMNKGLNMASGHIVGILNADDRYADLEVFGRVFDAFQDESVGACYSDMIYVNDEGETTRRWNTGKNSAYKWYFGWMPPHPTFFVKRELYEQHGTFNTELSISADYELMLRLGKVHRVKFAYIQAVNVHMTPGGHSARGIKTTVRANAEVRTAWKMNRLRGGVLAPLLKPVLKMFQFNRFSRN